MPRSPMPLLPDASGGRTAVLQGLLITALVISGLYFGREMLLPLTLAILLSFVLTPPILLLRRLKVPRVLAVGFVVIVAFAIIGGLGWLISLEATKLAAELPTYRATLSEKVSSVRETTSESKVLEKAEEVLADLKAQFDQPDAPAVPDANHVAGQPEGKPIPVVIREPDPTGLALYQSIAGTILPPLITAGIVLLFVIFILIQREDLRDRLMRLFGGSDLQRATTTMSDAASRLSHYFLSQVLINAAYGIFIGLALWAIGMPSPVAWGILAMVMRFVPYVGAYIAAIIPALVAAAIDPGWSMVLMVIGLFAIGEMTMGQFIEPQVYGRGTGVTPIAVIGCTIFWTYLWGPLGLIIATPITVCLSVLGRHVEGLHFLEVLLGDQPALTPEQSFYQRTLIGDPAEVTYQAEFALKEQSFETYLDHVALGGLKLAERDVARGALDRIQQARIATTVNEILERLADFEPRRWFSKLRRKGNAVERKEGVAIFDAPAEAIVDAEHIIDRRQLAPGWQVETPVLCIGGHTILDEAAGALLAAVLAKRGLGAKALPPEAIATDHISVLANTKARAVGLSYLGLGAGAADICNVVQLLRGILPKGTKIFIADWEAEDAAATQAALGTAQADAYASTLHEAVEICLQAATGKPNSKAKRRATKTAAASTSAKKRRSPTPRKRQPGPA